MTPSRLSSTITNNRRWKGNMPMRLMWSTMRTKFGIVEETTAISSVIHLLFSPKGLYQNEPAWISIAEMRDGESQTVAAEPEKERQRAVAKEIRNKMIIFIYSCMNNSSIIYFKIINVNIIWGIRSKERHLRSPWQWNIRGSLRLDSQWTKRWFWKINIVLPVLI